MASPEDKRRVRDATDKLKADLARWADENVIGRLGAPPQQSPEERERRFIEYAEDGVRRYIAWVMGAMGYSDEAIARAAASVAARWSEDRARVDVNYSVPPVVFARIEALRADDEHAEILLHPDLPRHPIGEG